VSAAGGLASASCASAGAGFTTSSIGVVAATSAATTSLDAATSAAPTSLVAATSGAGSLAGALVATGVGAVASAGVSVSFLPHAPKTTAHAIQHHLEPFMCPPGQRHRAVDGALDSRASVRGGPIKVSLRSDGTTAPALVCEEKSWHAACEKALLSGDAMRIFITGATGFLGRAITEAAIGRGDEVVGLSRRPQPKDYAAVRWVAGDPADPRGEWTRALAGTSAVIHLAGEPIGDKRWTDERKAKIRDSRILGTRGLVEALGNVPEVERPKVLVAANGVDYYPFDDSDTPWSEEGRPGTGYLEDLCAAWQVEAEMAKAHGMRVVTLRTGIVLAAGGGAFPRLVMPFKLFAGGRIGSGRQWFSWVHLEDVVRAYLFAVDTPALAGPVNLVAPGAVRASELARQIGKALHRPAWFPVPRFAVKMAAGEIAHYLTAGRRVVPAKLVAAGFGFRYPAIGEALPSLLGGRKA
jgi:uncharacterized protein (TIGR01777 family)